MSLATIYPWLKALHVASAFVFVGGVLAVSVILAVATTGMAIELVARRMRRWDQAVTTPAMLLVWGLGLSVATAGALFSERWLQIKLVFVLVLSGLHGMQSGRLRRLAGGGAAKPMRAGPLVLLCILAIAILAVVKPF